MSLCLVTFIDMSTTTIQQFELFIDGQIRPASKNEYFESINPSTGEVFARVACSTKQDMAQAIASARKVFDSGVWTQLNLHERGQYLNKIARLIRENAKELAELECLDTGKTIKQATFIDVPTAADSFEYFGHVNSQLNGEVIPVPDPVRCTLEHEPRGVVGCIIPWNYPLILAAWKIAPALMAGNCVILKPSPLASVSLMRLAQIIEKVGLPKGVLNIVSGKSNEVASELAKSPDVDMISFTGSNVVGQEIMRLAANTTKKVVLELGGKSASIVFADCDFETALGGVMSSIFMNQGQMCTACSRLLLEEKIYDQFLNRLVEKTKNLKIGPANNYQTDFGPLISKEHREKILGYIETGKKEGAKLVCGGKIPLPQPFPPPRVGRVREGGDGFYLEPTIFTDVKSSMTIAREETFGPVLSVIKFSDCVRAYAIANDSKYGLAASIWTKDLEKANLVSKKLQCGTVWINTYGGFYNEVPFGGYKQSGFGRELGVEGLLEYTQTKSICLDQTPGGKSLVASWF